MVENMKQARDLTLDGEPLTADKAAKSKVLWKKRKGVYERGYGRRWREGEI